MFTFSSLVHFGAVVADAPSPLSTPRSATGQAQLRLGKPLRMKCITIPTQPPVELSDTIEQRAVLWPLVMF